VGVEIPASDVRAEVDRILASRGFANAGRLSRLLRYVVDKTLANEPDQLKEYSVGVEVFERDEKYDPRLDSIVRVEAGRLRSRLDEYYNGEGANSPIRITLPRGGYVALFESSSAKATEDKPQTGKVQSSEPQAAIAPTPRRSRAAMPLAVGLICAIAAMVAWLGGWNRLQPADDRPSIAVLAFEANVAGADQDKLAQRLTEGVTSELARLGTLSVVSYTSAMQFAGQRRPISEIRAALGADFVFEGSVDEEPGGLLLVARLVNAANDRKVWVSDYRGGAGDIRGISQRAAFDASATILRLR
jgi:TolB-like protein